MNRKVLSILLVLAMMIAAVATFASCTDPVEPGTTPVEYVDPYKDITDKDELSAAIYEDVLGDSIKAYEAAKAETNESKKWAMMAISTMSSAICPSRTARCWATTTTLKIRSALPRSISAA